MAYVKNIGLNAETYKIKDSEAQAYADLMLETAEAYSDANLQEAKDYTDDQLANYKVIHYTDEKNNEILVDEFIGICRTYFKKRTKTVEGETVNVFQYGTTETALDSDYYTGSNKIDCSCYVGMCLRGISFDNSPYGPLNLEDVAGDSEPVEDPIEGDDPQDGSGTGRYMQRNAAYKWSVNPGLSLISPTGDNRDTPTPVRNSGQLAEYYVRQGRVIYANPDPLGHPDPDAKYENVEKGDLVFWSKPRFIEGEGYDEADGYKNKNRFWNISHVAVVANKYVATGAVAAAGYPYKHTTFEVSTPSHIVLNRSIEKISRADGGNYNYPDQKYISLIVRPNMGTISHDEKPAYQLTADEITNLNTVYAAGLWYLTSAVTDGLPTDVSSGSFYVLEVKQTANKWGEPYSIIQELTHTRTGRQYVRVQYCYSNDYTPTPEGWTEWRQICINLSNGYIDANEYDLDYMYTPGRYILATRITGGLPYGETGHTYQTLEVEANYTKGGDLLSLKQVFTDTQAGRICIRTQNCYDDPPNIVDWTPWKEITMTVLS